MIQITDVILISLFIEAIVNALKPIWTKGETRLTVSEYVSMGMGVLLAVTCKINMLAYVVDVEYPIWVEYIFYTLTGIAIGRGTNFVYDLWDRMKEWQSGKALEIVDGIEIANEDEVDLNIDNWSLAQIKSFCELNDINADGCVSREDYMNAIERETTTQPPVAGGAE